MVDRVVRIAYEALVNGEHPLLVKFVVTTFFNHASPSMIKK